MNEFIIDFKYDGILYSGLVTPVLTQSELQYSVVVESENQEIHLEIIANHCGDGKLDWCYLDRGESASANPFDKAFLQEIGEAIEKHETQSI